MKKLFTLLFFLYLNLSIAQVSMYEQEPNNTPLAGNVFQAPMIILGTMQDQDQDMFIWEVSDVDAGYLWDIQLAGIPDSLTKLDIMQLSFTEDGTGVTKVQKLTSMNNHGGISNISKTGLVFAPGTYYFGLSYARGKNKETTSPLLGDKLLTNLGQEYVTENQKIDSLKVNRQNTYELNIIKGKVLNSLDKNNNSKNNPMLLRQNLMRGLFFEDQTNWLKFNISAKQANTIWNISGHINLGQSIKMDLIDADGKTITTSKSNSDGAYFLSDIKLAEGTYLLSVNSEVNAIASIELQNSGEYVDGNEVEPNDSYQTANQFLLEKSISAKMNKPQENDFFKFTLTEESSILQFDLKLTNHDQTKLSICLFNQNNTRLQCKESESDITLSQLLLDAGEYVVGVSRGKIDSKYTLEYVNKGPKTELMEAEPNDTLSYATMMSQKRIVKGNFNGDDVDYFIFNVNESSQMWTIQAIGEEINSIAIFNSANQNRQSNNFSRGTKRAKISNLNLQPGKHIIQLKGKDSAYILRAFATGPVDESFETEPNNIAIYAMPIYFDQPRKGLLDNSVDVDMYRFNLKNEQGVNLVIQPAQDADIYYKLHWEGMLLGRKSSKPGEQLTFKGMLPAGDYSLSVQPNKSVSDDVYQISLNQVNLNHCKNDCEPNDSVHQANLIQASINLTGQTGTHEDYDWYKLPPYSTETIVTFENLEGIINNDITGFVDYDKRIQSQLIPEKNQLSFIIPANSASYFRLTNQSKKYEYKVLINNQKIEAVVQNDSDLKLSLQNMPKFLPAFSPYSQQINANLVIENNGTIDQNIILDSTINDYRWSSEHTQNIIIKSNAKTSVPIQINVPNELSNNQQVRINVSISNEIGFLTETWHDILVNLDAPLLQADAYWAIDKKLLGGINVASSALGSKRTTDDIAFNVNTIGSNFDDLFDGIAADGLGMQYREGRKSEQDFITIDLAGDDEILVQGILLNPISRGKPNVYLKDFELHLSLDGVNFQSVLKATLEPIGAEQSFILAKPIPAKFARLYLLNSYDSHPRSATTLGEWKVIADPSQSFNSGKGFNIADPDLGGYVVWSTPQTSGEWDINLLTEKQENKYIRSKITKDWEWVVGFHNQRAAKIDKIEWQHPIFEARKDRLAFDHVKVLTSMNSNVGPWTVVEEKKFINLDTMDEIVFEQPIWARYVKFSVGNVKTGITAYFPETIRIFEHPTSEDYQSIIGEWGEYSANSMYELTHNQKINKNISDTNNHNKETAIDLTDKKTISGQVQLEQTEKLDWYKFSTKTGNNTLKIQLSGKQTIETVIKVEDSEGNNIPLIVHSKKTNEIEYRIPVEANQDYYVIVEEPPRSVIFVWDTSGSTQPYHPMIYDAISSYSNDVIEGRDTVNFLPFGGSLLMKDWYGRPDYLKTIMNNYKRLDNSSSAEKYLHKAAVALEKRQGSKAIIIITDAITSKYEQVWDALKIAKPRVFSIGIITNGFGGNPNRQIDLMQSWSMVNNGDFQKANNTVEVEQAFERAAVKLRQPANYTLNITSEYIKEPGPGSLIVTEKDNANNSAVELILDASGSMLKQLNGKRRINIAKEVLINAVTEIIPEGTPLALRVFGDKQANACRTDLAIKLSPLNPKSAKSTLENIHAKNLAKTPIADSLAKVADDLKSHQGKKIVILVTDGEETCDGNPEEVIAQLVDQGIDIRLNIVGFAIDDEELKQQFNQWSVQGGGKYFDSNNPESLKNSVSHALKTPFSVFSMSGELIKEGVVNGDSLELPAGHYTINVYGNDVITYENYHIKGEKEQEIEL